MIKRFLVPLVVAPLLFTALSASAATFNNITAAPGFTYSPAPATTILFLNDNVNPQDPDSIKLLIESEFGLLGSPLTYVSACDSASCDNATGLNSDSFTSDDPFNYLAIHFGGSELFFYWATAITQFSISNYQGVTSGGLGGQGGGLSNYRAYSDGLSEVPVPAAGWLFGTALLGLMGLRRKM